MAKALLETLALVNSSPGGSNVLKAVPNTPVYVYLAGTSTLADLFLDAAGTLPTANPTTTDGYGNIGPPAGSPAVSQALYVEEGADYDVTINGIRQRVRVPAGGSGALDADLVSIAALDATQSGVMASDGAGWVRKTYAALKTALGLTKADVGLSNADNTSDANKPVSSAQQTALAGKEELDISLRPREVFVEEWGSDSAHPRRGEAPLFAYATIQAAVNALIDSAPGVGGVVHVGEGTFAPAVLDGKSRNLQGIKLKGSGLQTTIIESASPGVDALRITSPGGTDATKITLEDFALLGDATTGWGLNFGGNDWRQIGRVIARNLRIENNGAGGVICYDINDCLFENVGTDDNYGPAWRVTGSPSDGVDTIERGNTVVWLNCRTNGRTTRTTNGWEFINAGNSWTIIGGETQFFAEAVVVTNSGSSHGLNFLGVHFENNLRSVHLGDQAAIGGDANAVFRSCFFLAAPGSPDHVLLDGVDRTRFQDCIFAGSTTATIVEAPGRANNFEVDNCAAGAGIPLITFRDGSTKATARTYRHNGRFRASVDSASSLDAFTGAFWARNTFNNEPFYAMENASGLLGIYMGNGSPEGTVTANTGSIYLRRAGGIGQTIYYKATGTGATGWIEMTPAGPRPFLLRTSNNYTLTATDQIVVSNVAAPATHTLPSASATGVGAGKKFTIKNAHTAGGDVTVTTTSSQTIDGAATDTIAVGASMTYVSDGANWRKLP